MAKSVPTIYQQGWADGILGNEPKSDNLSYMRGYKKGNNTRLIRLGWAISRSIAYRSK